MFNNQKEDRDEIITINNSFRKEKKGRYAVFFYSEKF